MILYLNLIFFILIFLSILELNHRLRPTSPLELRYYNFKFERISNKIVIIGFIEIINAHQRMEVMVPSLEINLKFLGLMRVKNLNITKTISLIPHDKTFNNSNYWNTVIINESNPKTYNINIEIENDNKELEQLNSVWLETKRSDYGPFGLINNYDGILIPIKYPDRLNLDKMKFEISQYSKMYPIRTHLLSALDNPYKVMTNYTKDLLMKGDILTIGETPLAIMQGRYINPKNLRIGFLSRNLTRVFHPTSSLATAGGMQSLIDIYGPSRILISWTIGSFMKFIGFKGFFYRLAGSQARLIDDLTGTIPPYDQTIVLGPKNHKYFCEKLSSELGVAIAVVDVNDLGKVKILSSSSDCDTDLISLSLASNPAGNGNQKTPIVLIRP